MQIYVCFLILANLPVSFFPFKIYLLALVGLCLAVLRLSLVAVTQGCSSSDCVGFHIVVASLAELWSLRHSGSSGTAGALRHVGSPWTKE